ncbi:MAG: D-alanine--D-alanine ligase [Alphaproteobacteria bacterium]|nr:D-alanine--D-alanine ligase [Alphaproteobacteria bacterium]
MRSGGRSVAIVHGRVAPDAPPDEQDTLLQVTEVSAQLAALGWKPVPIPVDLNLQRLSDRLKRLKPAFAFNLVESLDGKGALIGVVPQLLDAMGIAYTGCSADAIVATASKLSAKRAMDVAGIDTAAWIEPEDLAAGQIPDGRFIVKSVWEHASIGLDASSIGEGAALREIQAEREARFGGGWFAEAFIDGREFNLALIGSAGAPRLLPPAEIEFVGFAPDQPRLVDYAAKWDPESHAYNNTPRRYDFDGDDVLLARLEAMARHCWRLFRLSGCARVDFRVDGRGRPWVLEVNANPCLASDAGLVAAARRVGLDQADIVREIVRSLDLEPARQAAVG